MILKAAKYLWLPLILGNSLQVNASPVADPAGDYLAGYFGSKTGDLDVIDALLSYNPVTDIFHFESTFNGPIGGSPDGFYVLGINRGDGTALFAADGLPDVLFDSIVRINNNGTGNVILLGSTNTSLDNGSVAIQGSRIVADIAGNLLPENGFEKTAYTWNLWPRDGSQPTGFGQISDFAPNASNAAVQVVPLPAAVWLFGTMLGLSCLSGKRRAGLDKR